MAHYHSLQQCVVSFFKQLFSTVKWVTYELVCVLRINTLFWKWREKSAGINDIGILYQSKDFLVVNKHYDVLINSNNAGDLVTVQTQLEHLYPQNVDHTCQHKFRFVHRLDFATSGALCIALTKKGAASAFKAFKEHKVDKKYIALVRGHVTPSDEQLEINIGIGKDLSVKDFNKMCVESSSECSSPRDAHTSLLLLEHGWYDDDEQPVSKVLLTPHTGRTHQLRIHCRHIGHTIVGDYCYSDRKDVKPYRMMLHAHKLSINTKHEQISVTAGDPFTPGCDTLWKPQRIFNSCEDNL